MNCALPQNCYQWHQLRMSVTSPDSFSATLENGSLHCSQISPYTVICGGVQYDEIEPDWAAASVKFWLFVTAYIVIVLFAGLMSGLTLAIFSLDLMSLRVLSAAGSEIERKYALKIMPLVNKQYLVLVSLVLANAVAVEAMPLLLDRISTPLIAMVVSVTAVLLFGEVLPQAVCGRYGLKIAYTFSWLVWTIISIEFVIAYPISLCLERLLGKNQGTFYRRSELKALVDFHGPRKKPSFKRKAPDKKNQIQSSEEPKLNHQEERLTIDEVLIIKGALELATKHVVPAMVKIDEVFMLSEDAIMDYKTLVEIMELGHSRIPVYQESRNNIVGILLTKRLILVDPNKGVPLKDLMTNKRYFYPVFWIDEWMPLYTLLNKFQEGASSHMAFVRRPRPDGSNEVLGVVTLEDILEEILQEEIYDETDVYRGTKNGALQVDRRQNSLFNGVPVQKKLKRFKKHNIDSRHSYSDSIQF